MKQQFPKDVLTDCIFVTPKVDTTIEDLRQQLLNQNLAVDFQSSSQQSGPQTGIHHVDRGDESATQDNGKTKPEINPSMPTGTARPTTTDLVLFNRSEERAIMTTQKEAGHDIGIIPPWNEILEMDHQSILQQSGPQTGTADLDLERGYAAGSSTQQQQTQNHSVVRGNESEDKVETTKNNPAEDIVRLVLAFLAFYSVMLGYLGWGPTSSSPRKSHPTYFWVSIGMLAYVTFALFGVLRMHKVGGTWTWWARFLSFTIYPAALIGCAVLIVLVSLH